MVDPSPHRRWQKMVGCEEFIVFVVLFIIVKQLVFEQFEFEFQMELFIFLG